MDTHEALKKLAAAGLAGEALDLLRRKAESVSATYREIREDETRTDEAKRQRLAAAHAHARRDVDTEIGDMAAKVVRIDRDDAERVFGVKGLPGDEASLIISRRDAADRLAGVTDTGELRELLRRATRSGDEVLARAVAEKAVENLDDTTMHQFLADRPQLDAAVERLWNARRATNESFALTMHLGALRPAELSGMASQDIEALADPSAAPWPQPLKHWLAG